MTIDVRKIHRFSIHAPATLATGEEERISLQAFDAQEQNLELGGGVHVLWETSGALQITPAKAKSPSRQARQAEQRLNKILKARTRLFQKRHFLRRRLTT